MESFERSRSLSTMSSRSSERDSDELSLAATSLTIGTANAPVMAGNQLNLNVEGSPGAKIAGVVFENHFHYGTSTSTSESENMEGEHTGDGDTRITEDEILAEIVSALKKHYSSKAAWLVPFEWMREQKLPPEEYYVDLDIVRLSRSNRFVKQQAVSLEKILQPDSESNTEPQSVLIHGEPGIGKTTVCIEVVYSWSTKKDSPFSVYPLVIFVPFRALDVDIDTFIVDLCCKAIRERPPFEAVVRKILRDLGSKLLLILDSLEELPHNVEESFFRLLTFDQSRQQSLLYQATVMITTRPNPPMEFIEVFNRHVRINGFSYGQQKEYLGKYFAYEAEKLEKMEAELELGTYRGLGACPLMLYILCYLHDVSGDILRTTRATDIYATVTSLLITRSANRESERPDTVLSQRDLDHFLIQLGHLCCNCMREGRLYVTEGEILLIFSSQLEQKIVKGSGLIKLAVYPQKIKKDYFEPSHRSFFEYLAAKSFRFELSKVVSQEKRFSLIQNNDRLLTKSNSPVLIYLYGLDTESQENRLLSLEYFQQNEQTVTTNDPLLNLKIPGIANSAFSIVTSSLLMNEVTSSRQLGAVLDLTKPYDQTPNFTAAPPFFYQGFKKFLSCNLKPIKKLVYDVGFGNYGMELNVLRCAPRIEKLILNLNVPFDDKQLQEGDRSPCDLLRGILELENVDYLSVTVKASWVKAFLEEVNSSFRLNNLKYLHFEDNFAFEDFIILWNWIREASSFMTFLSCDISFVTCSAREMLDACVELVLQKHLSEVNFLDGKESGGDISLTSGTDPYTVKWKENAGGNEDEILEQDVPGSTAKVNLCYALGFEDCDSKIALQAHFLKMSVTKLEVSFMFGMEVGKAKQVDEFVSCYRSIQLGDKNLEWQGDMPVIPSTGEVNSWYQIAHNVQGNVSSW